MSDAIFHVRNLKVCYGGNTVLYIDELVISPRQIVGLVGPNGSGKSTLLKTLAMLIPPSSGDVGYRGSSDEPSREVTLLLQEPFLLKRTVFENVAYGLRVRGKNADSEARVRMALQMVGLRYDVFAHRLWFQLSGGEAQRASLASRLVLRPRVLLMDEPTASVDEHSANLIKEAAEAAVAEWGTTVILATHDTVWLHDVASQIVSLYRGKIVGRASENLISGPWTRTERGWCATLPTGATVTGHFREGCGFSEGCADDPSVGIVSPDDVKIGARDGAPHTQNANTFCGTVTHMALEGSGSVLATVRCGGTTIKSRVPSPGSIYPGMDVTLNFAPQDIRWL